MNIHYNTRRCPSTVGRPDIELLNILKIMYEVIGDPHKSNNRCPTDKDR